MGDNLEPVVASIENKITRLPTLYPNFCIYKIPAFIRQVNEDAYQPLVVSIGPLYCDDPKLQPMQVHKLIYLRSFLQRNIDNNISDYVQIIRQQQQKVRNCYAEPVTLDDNTFVEMVFIDAAFIVELFVRYCHPSESHRSFNISGDRIFGNPKMFEQVKHDMWLEENQLPFFILKNLYELAFPPSSEQYTHIPFVNLTYTFFFNKQDNPPYRVQKVVDIKHFVHFLRICYLPCDHTTEHPSGNNQTIAVSINGTENQKIFSPSVTMLREAGVKFKARTSEDLLDIKFDHIKGVLEIPTITLEDNTESWFRNIIAFEQCRYEKPYYITDYFAFLDGLIDTQKDVEILVQNGIFDNWLGSNEEAANLFNKMFKQVYLDPKKFIYLGICRALNEYASTSWHKWRAMLKHKYFNHPWAIISVIYAIVILIVAVLQTKWFYKEIANHSQ